VRIVGLEIRRKWATLVDERLAARGLSSRARVFAEDASLALPRLGAATVQRVFVHFPDPWWKKRHHKRLVVVEPFIREVVRVLVPDGQIFVQTDVGERAVEYERVLSATARLTPVGVEPRVADNPFSAKSSREHRADADGLPVYRLLYRLSSP
jgi:tRNA (guanine-N7-)-methyltransferase